MTNTATSDHQATSTALARHDEHHAAIEPRNLAELERFAAAAAKSGFFGAKNQEQALMIAMAGRDLGLSYTQALRMFHVIDPGPDRKTGEPRPPKLVISADGMVAVCLSKPGICEYFRIIESDARHATVEAKRVGDNPRRYSFSIDDAQKAGLVKDWGNWKTYPERMCLARAKAFLARDLFPDLLAGLYDPDEIRDSLAVEQPPTRREKGEVVELRPQPAPAPAPSSPAVSAEPSAAAQAFAASIAQATKEEDLVAVAKAMDDANLSESDKTFLRRAYAKKRDAIRKGGAK